MVSRSDLAGAIAEVKRSVLSEAARNRTQTFSELALGFVHAVDWSEPWLWVLGAGHLMLLLTVVVTRRHWLPQGVLLVLLASAVLLAEHLNSFLAAHWRVFATQNYFDPHGVFISVVFSLPLTLITAFIMLHGVYHAGSLMVQAKRAEFRVERKKKAAADAEAKAAAAEAKPKDD